jgi:hypothetical protein
MTGERSTGVPTGAYQLLIVPTPLDPKPHKRQVYDGGFAVPPECVFEARGEGLVVPSTAPKNSGLAATALQTKYLVTPGADAHSISITMPVGGSLFAAILDAHNSCLTAGRDALLSDVELAVIDRMAAFHKKFLRSTSIRVSAVVPDTWNYHGDELKKYLNSRKVTLPPVEELLACCALNHAITGCPLITHGRYTMTHGGVLELVGGQIRLRPDNLDRYYTDPQYSKRLVFAGVVGQGKQTPITTPVEKLVRRIKAMFI